MTESAQQPPKQPDISGPLHAHLGEAAKPEVVKDGYTPLGKAARDQAEAGEGTGVNPAAPPKGARTPNAHERLRRQAEGR
jgi:hypothetical protein